MADDPILRRADRKPFVTKDGSLVTELVHPTFTNACGQSVAEAVVGAGGETIAHRHHRAEEIYLFTAGSGRLSLADSTFAVGAGDSVVIPPGIPHKLWNSGSEALVLLCISAPAYSDADTELLE